MNNRAIVLANGLFPKRSEALQALLQSPLIVCCDGAYAKLAASGIFSRATTLPRIEVVGDGDSLSAKQRAEGPTATFIDDYKDQDTNDLTKAVKHAVGLGATHVLILGATGLREDHTLANISLLGPYAGMTTAAGSRLGVRIYSDHGVFTPIMATATLASFARQQVSLFALKSDMVLSTEGLRYPLEHRRLRWWWEASLNEALGDTFTVSIENPSPDGVVVVYQTHEAK